MTGAPKLEFVREMFDRVAETYDVVNGWLAFGFVDAWRAREAASAAKTAAETAVIERMARARRAREAREEARERAVRERTRPETIRL